MQLKMLPPLPHDPSNAIEKMPAAIALGKRLFFDPRFSRDGTISCSRCHDPNRNYQDDRPLAQALGTAARRTPSIVGTAYSPWLFWDGRKDSLWSQALGPLEDGNEHGGTRTQYVALLRQFYRAEYEGLFGAFPDLPSALPPASPLGSAAERKSWQALDRSAQESVLQVFANLGKILGAYVKTLMPGESRFDRYVANVLSDGRLNVQPQLSRSEIDGLKLFIGKARCATCHAGPLFTDHHFHSTRVPPREVNNPDLGRAAAITKLKQDEFNCLGRFSDAPPSACEELRFMTTTDAGMFRAFKTPSLRNVALRPPYMHAGQLASLRDVLRHYNQAPDAALGPDGMVHKLGINSELKPLTLTEIEQQNLIDFLGSLNGPIIEIKRP